jgi:hypothetical protein
MHLRINTIFSIKLYAFKYNYNLLLKFHLEKILVAKNMRLNKIKYLTELIVTCNPLQKRFWQ